METLLVELEERDVHFVDTIIRGYDGIADLRRDYRLIEGRTFFILLVPPGFRREVEQLLNELREYASIGEVREDAS
jgi:hypothetical protein